MKWLYLIQKKKDLKKIEAAKKASFILKHINTCTNIGQLQGFQISVNNLLINKYPEEIHREWLPIIDRSFDNMFKKLQV